MISIIFYHFGRDFKLEMLILVSGHYDIRRKQTKVNDRSCKVICGLMKVFFLGSSTTLVNSQIHINDIIHDARSREKCKFFVCFIHRRIVVIKKAMEDVSDDDDKDLLTKLLKAKKISLSPANNDAHEK